MKLMGIICICWIWLDWIDAMNWLEGSWSNWSPRSCFSWNLLDEIDPVHLLLPKTILLMCCLDTSNWDWGHILYFCVLHDGPDEHMLLLNSTWLDWSCAFIGFGVKIPLVLLNEINPLDFCYLMKSIPCFCCWRTLKTHDFIRFCLMESIPCVC